MRTLALALTLVTALFAGCIGSDDTTEPLDENVDASTEPLGPLLPDGTPAPLSTTLQGCDEHFAVLPQPPVAAEGQIPDGFSLIPFDDAGLMITMVVLAYTCTYGNETVGEMHGAWLVEPPEELRSPEAEVHVVNFGAWTTHDGLLETYAAWGAGASFSIGEVSVATDATPLGRAGHALGQDDDLTVHLYTATTADETTQSPGLARVFFVEADHVSAILDVSWTESQQSVNGVAELMVDGGADPFLLAFGKANPGIAIHNWGEEYALTYHYVEAPMVEPHEH